MLQDLLKSPEVGQVRLERDTFQTGSGGYYGSANMLNSWAHDSVVWGCRPACALEICHSSSTFYGSSNVISVHVVYATHAHARCSHVVSFGKTWCHSSHDMRRIIKL